MKHPNATISIILALTILFAATLSFNIGQTEEKTTLFDQYYTIEPKSLRDSLKNGDTNAFTSATEEPELLPVGQQIPVDWLQADYFYIANALYDSILRKSLQGWQLQGMDFQLGCEQLHNGCQNGRFEFFKVLKEKEQESWMSRFIDIDPRSDFVHAIEERYYPKLADLKIIDMTKLKISAEYVLQIAESNGGKEKRQSVGNACDISLVLYPNSASYRG